MSKQGTCHTTHVLLPHKHTALTYSVQRSEGIIIQTDQAASSVAASLAHTACAAGDIITRSRDKDASAQDKELGAVRAE